MLYPLLVLAAGITPIPDAPAFRQPQLAVRGAVTGMTFGAGHSVYFAGSTDGGRTFGAPVKVATAAALALGRHRGPRLAITGKAMVISAVSGAERAVDLETWRSTDGGRTWTAGGRINDVPTSAREGLHAMTALPDGSVFAMWLDLRVKGMRLVGSKSTDGGLTWSPNKLVYASPGGSICECCHPTLAVDPSGRIWAMWRNSLDGNRDLYAASSTDGVTFSAATKQGQGTWQLQACPMDGGGLAFAGKEMVSAWRRDKEIFLARPGQPEQRLGTGKDAAVALTAKGAYAAWTREGAVEAHTPAGMVMLAPEGGFASLAALPDGAVLAAWETKTGIETRRLD